MWRASALAPMLGTYQLSVCVFVSLRMKRSFERIHSSGCYVWRLVCVCSRAWPSCYDYYNYEICLKSLSSICAPCLWRRAHSGRQSTRAPSLCPCACLFGLALRALYIATGIGDVRLLRVDDDNDWYIVYTIRGFIAEFDSVRCLTILVFFYIQE